jgi:hypothetical protein
MSQPVSLWMSLRFGQLEVNFSADEVSGYAPDVANDMALHVVKAFSEGIAELRAHGVIGTIDDDDEATDDTEDDDDDD